jgi:peptidoglycan L-alanyl-D-glutamate endopeptidase CwlK
LPASCLRCRTGSAHRWKSDTAFLYESMHNKIVMDSRMTLAESLAGTIAPRAVIRALRLLEVTYYSFDGRLHRGQLLLHEAVEKDVREIFRLIEAVRFPVGRAVPIVRYHWSDDASMADNNSSAFNYRPVAGTKRLSHHASGRAVDINPRQNPAVYKDGRIAPLGTAYDPAGAGAFSESSLVLRAFLSRGWQWGAGFETVRDYHHFQKP